MLTVFALHTGQVCNRTAGRGHQRLSPSTTLVQKSVPLLQMGCRVERTHHSSLLLMAGWAYADRDN